MESNDLGMLRNHLFSILFLTSRDYKWEIMWLFQDFMTREIVGIEVQALAFNVNVELMASLKVLKHYALMVKCE